MEKREIIKLWHIKANNDLKICEQSFKTDEIITDVICFHCQQAVEKYLKSYLIYVEEEISKTHNIAILVTRCSNYDSDFSTLSEMAFLTEYAVQSRYPDDFYIPDIDEAKEAYEKAIEVKEFVIKKMQHLYEF